LVGIVGWEIGGEDRKGIFEKREGIKKGKNKNDCRRATMRCVTDGDIKRVEAAHWGCRGKGADGPMFNRGKEEPRATAEKGRRVKSPK